ncbi:hypothetical protein WDZ92_37755 [Nostoc sp. NIES-2111]
MLQAQSSRLGARQVTRDHASGILPGAWCRTHRGVVRPIPTTAAARQNIALAESTSPRVILCVDQLHESEALGFGPAQYVHRNRGELRLDAAPQKSTPPPAFLAVA